MATFGGIGRTGIADVRTVDTSDPRNPRSLGARCYVSVRTRLGRSCRPAVQERRPRRFGSIVPLSARHAYASLADARSSFGDTGGGDDGAPPR